MRWRFVVNLLAVLSVLVHAGMIMRHHQVMLGAHLERQSLLSALGVICHSGGQTTAPLDAEVPWLPPLSDQQNGQCPLCAGLTTAVALPANVESGVPVHFRAAAPQLVRYEARPTETESVRPPTRGPPLLI
jgi:predicted CxxxxCH...CXXCH cytochrome family protein